MEALGLPALRRLMDCRVVRRKDGAEPVIGPRFARTRWRLLPGNDRPSTLTDVGKDVDGRDKPGHDTQFGRREFLLPHIGSSSSSLSHSE